MDCPPNRRVKSTVMPDEASTPEICDRPGYVAPPRAVARSMRNEDVSLSGSEIFRDTEPATRCRYGKTFEGRNFGWLTRGSVHSDLLSSRSTYSVYFPYGRIFVSAIGP